jgi:hypothetical protein
VQKAVLLRMFDAIRTAARTEDELRLAVKALILGMEGVELACEYMGFDVAGLRAAPTSASRKAGSTRCRPSSWASCSPWRRSRSRSASGAARAPRTKSASRWSSDTASTSLPCATGSPRTWNAQNDTAAACDGGALHPALLEPLIEKAITAWKAAGTTKKKKPEVEARLLMEVNVLRDAQADLRAGNTEEAMTELCELAGVGKFEGERVAQIVGDELRELLAPLQATRNR